MGADGTRRRFYRSPALCRGSPDTRFLLLGAEGIRHHLSQCSGVQSQRDRGTRPGPRQKADEGAGGFVHIVPVKSVRGTQRLSL